MAKYRRAAKVDSSQKRLVHVLRRLPGVTVSVGHDDILIGCKDKDGIPRTYWMEIKNPDAVGKDGKILESKITQSEKDRRANWKGHYKIVSSLEEIMVEIGLVKRKS